MAAPMSRFRAIEFYSGIGGMHYALRASKLDASVVAAIDINDLANKVYRYNFPHGNLMQRNVQSISKAEFTKLDADIFLMSPPCQPFTRVGLKGDSDDPRTQSFLHLLRVLPNLPKLPSYFLVENVKGFETSDTRNCLVQTLQMNNYTFQEFLLSPTHFSIPNQRLRYFLIAKQRPLEFIRSRITAQEHQVLLHHRVGRVCECESSVSDERLDRLQDAVETESVEHLRGGETKRMTWTRESSSGLDSEPLREGHTEIKDTQTSQFDNRTAGEEESQGDPSAATSSSPGPQVCRRETGRTCHHTPSKSEAGGECPSLEDELKSADLELQSLSLLRNIGQEKSSLEMSSRVVGDYLESLSAEALEKLMLPDKLLKRFARIADVVTPDDSNTRCFTKAYGHYVEGTGSMLQMNSVVQGKPLLKSRSHSTETLSDEFLEQLRNLKIRYFSPREIANLHHFPDTFGFPDDLTLKQRYRVLGNSLNIHVVSVLLRYLVTE